MIGVPWTRRALQCGGPSAPQAYVIGVDAVSRFFATAEECSIVTRLVEGGGLEGGVRRDAATS